MDETLNKMTVEGLHKVLDHVIGLMERAERRAEKGGEDIFKYLPKYSVLLKGKIRVIGENKGALIEMINALYSDSFVKMLHKYEEATGFMGNEGIAKSETTSGHASETTAPSPFSEAPSMSPVNAPTPTSPSFFNTFNLQAARAAKKAKKGGATRRQTKRFRRKRRQ